MTAAHRILLGSLFVLGLLQVHLACTSGGGGGSAATSQPAPPPAPADFTLALAAGNLTVTAGSNVTLTVAVNRDHGHSAAINLSVDGLPAGVSATGSIPAGAGSGQVVLAAAPNMTAQTLTDLSVKGTDGALTRTSSGTFTLTLLPALPPIGGSLSTELVHASGSLQSGQGVENVSLVGEPFAVAAAKAGTVENRTGFTPPVTH